MVIEGDGLTHEADDGHDVHRLGFGWGGQGVEEVPAVVEFTGQVSKVGQADAEGVGQEDGPGECIVTEEAALDVIPPVVEAELARDLVE